MSFAARPAPIAAIAATATIAACLAFGAAPVRAQIYTRSASAEQDSIVLSNHASDSTPVLLLADDSPPAPAKAAAAAEPALAAASGPAVARPPSLDRRAVDALVSHVARESGLPVPLMRAIVHRESNFDSAAVSPKGAMGLMQLMPATAARFGVRLPFDPYDNLRGGAAYLRILASQFGNRVDLVLAAYNAGENAVIQAGTRVPKIRETQDYVRSILSQVRCRHVYDCRETATPPRPQERPQVRPVKVTAGSRWTASPDSAG